MTQTRGKWLPVLIAASVAGTFELLAAVNGRPRADLGLGGDRRRELAEIVPLPPPAQLRPSPRWGSFL